MKDRGDFLTKARSLLADQSYDAVTELAHERLQSLPGDVDARIVLCRAVMGKNDFAEAQRLLTDLESLFSDVAALLAAMGDHCRQTGSMTDAVSYYRRCLALEPGNARAQEWTLFLDDAERAEPPDEDGEDRYDEVTDLAEDFRTLTLVELYIRQGHLDMAAEVLEQIVKRDGTNEKAAELLRCVQAKRERVPPAHKTPLIAELTRWMKNIDRIRIHAR